MVPKLPAPVPKALVQSFPAGSQGPAHGATPSARDRMSAPQVVCVLAAEASCPPPHRVEQRKSSLISSASIM